ncbi:MAG TPA: hypothetical protein VGK20_00280 [Candidatus Binatia bacterium]|jgi:uncharacterized small protein (DUF1192 family)
MTETDPIDPQQQEIARLRAENERLKKPKPRPDGVSFKVSDKGGVSVYGMGRFPVTLYVEQWDKLLARADDLRAFIEENRASLKKKDAEKDAE